MSESAIKPVIAERKLDFITDAGEKTEVTITFAAPAQVGEHEWICRFEVRGIPGWKSQVYQANGYDSVQALILSLQLAGSLLRTAADGDPKRVPDWGGDFGFPQMPKITPEERALVDAAIQEAAEQQATEAATKPKDPKKRKKT